LLQRKIPRKLKHLENTLKVLLHLYTWVLRLFNGRKKLEVDLGGSATLLAGKLQIHADGITIKPRRLNPAQPLGLLGGAGQPKVSERAATGGRLRPPPRRKT
jgi:hypothetical protein